jgi:hypothetical protein
VSPDTEILHSPRESSALSARSTHSVKPFLSVKPRQFGGISSY